MAFTLQPLALSCSLSEVLHRDDDTIAACVRILTADGKRTLIEAVVESDFWTDARVVDHDALRVATPLDDIDALVIALFEELGAQVRELGTKHLSACYPDFRVFLAEHLPVDVAARLDAALSRTLPTPAPGTITFKL